jgi:hypothetical protein
MRRQPHLATGRPLGSVVYRLAAAGESPKSAARLQLPLF